MEAAGIRAQLNAGRRRPTHNLNELAPFIETKERFLVQLELLDIFLHGYSFGSEQIVLENAVYEAVRQRLRPEETASLQLSPFL
jgi:hypothetical protein